MNLREGTRRLALLLGVVGAILGGIASYFQLQPVLAQRALHNRFESLAASELVQLERKLLPPKGKLSDRDIADLVKIQSGLPKGDPRVDKISSLIASARPDSTTGQEKTAPAKLPDFIPADSVLFDDVKPTPSDWQDVSLVNRGGIKTIVWAENRAVYSIETEEGEVLRPTPPPSLWVYFLTASFPGLGFIFPWGAVRAIGWVGVGFFPPPK